MVAQKHDIHLTNVTGTGACQLIQNLLPELEKTLVGRIDNIFLPADGPLAKYRPKDPAIKATTYKRKLPKLISRFFETIIFSIYKNNKNPILVLGDLPLRVNHGQTLFLQTPHLVEISKGLNFRERVKFAVARLIFKLNISKVDAVIVQTQSMRQALIENYPILEDRTFIVKQPPPNWLIDSKIARKSPSVNYKKRNTINLIYPAAHYSHKNHSILKHMTPELFRKLNINEITLTIDREYHPKAEVEMIKCVGKLGPNEMVSLYSKADALLFLSNAESYGFPLLEAMYVNLPIICPNLPYVRDVCGEAPIFFEPNNFGSLAKAIQTLNDKLMAGWWPDWNTELEKFPKNWQQVAAKFEKIM